MRQAEHDRASTLLPARTARGRKADAWWVARPRRAIVTSAPHRVQAGYERPRMQPVLTEPLFALAARWRVMFRGPIRRATFATVALALVLSAITARSDAARSRVFGLALIGMLVIGGWLASVIGRRRRRDPARILLGTIARVDRVRAGRALRALSLVGRDGEVQAEGTSPALARLHVVRVMADLPSESVLSWGARRARWLNTAGWLLLGLVLALVMGNLW